ncbi:zinc finger protein 277 [Nilaparvata lugens]|uniref:zinc finger protein 277 n=1 Tax=Nilaparvata lugens TaxID=108931 RepID=UPI000B99155D|nr:zinc finger protein 277 [Nilaparvata lugens]
MFGPLHFKTTQISYDGHEIDCVFCDKKFKLPTETKMLSDHIFKSHKLFIDSIEQVAILEKYLTYWKGRFSIITKEELLGSTDKEYHTLSDQLEEDKLLREQLRAEKLELALEKQRQEREANSYARDCLFCHTHVRGNVADYVSHLWAKHNLQLGRPDNLVYVDQLINTIQAKMDSLLCIYCEKVFKDRNVLKEHMRKKLHKRINPKNSEYDKFYIVNYLSSGQVEKTSDDCTSKASSDSEADNSDWSDWIEDSNCSITCLLCRDNFTSFDDTVNHMKLHHKFDYSSNTKELSFYQQVKLVNFIRRQVHRGHCFCCDISLESDLKMTEHLCEHQDLMPEQSLWDQPEYFFPTYENDFFLCHIVDPQEDGDTSSGIDVYCETQNESVESSCS